MRITTYKKKMDSVLKHRPRFESQSVHATVTLTGSKNEPMIDMSFNDQVVTLDLEEANKFAAWVKKVAR